MTQNTEKPLTTGLKITGVGKYLPVRAVPSQELDEKLGKESGWVEKNYGIRKRFYANETETTSFMAAQAARQALTYAGLEASDLDCIISACAVMEQALPGTAPLIQRHLGLESSGCATLDVNCSCLSFLSALDIANLYIKAGRFQTILIVSSDIASVGLDWNEPDICTNFGDGAAAVVVCASNQNGVLSAHVETFSEGYDYCQIPAGGTRLHPSRFRGDLLPVGLFRMNGRSAFRLTSRVTKPFLDKLLSSARVLLEDINIVIPHQASAHALSHIRKRMKVPPEKFLDIYGDHGNQVAASLPTALYEAITSGRLKRGDRAMLVGTAAGLSLGGIVLEY